MNLINYFSSNARQWDKIKIEFRLLGITVFELKSDISKRCFRIVLFNIGIGHNCQC